MREEEFDLSKYIQGRTAVFIDAANIMYSQQSLGWKVDYKKLSKYLNVNAKIVYMGFYYSIDNYKDSQKKFLEIMVDTGYTLVLKPVKYIKTEKGFIKKGNLDIEIALDIIVKADSYKTCLIFSGDSDFESVLKYLKSKDKNVIVISTKKHISIELIRISNKYIDLRKMKEFISK